MKTRLNGLFLKLITPVIIFKVRHPEIFFLMWLGSAWLAIVVLSLLVWH